MNRSRAPYEDETSSFATVWQSADAEDFPSTNNATTIIGGQAAKTDYSSFSKKLKSRKLGSQIGASNVFRASERERKTGVSGRMGSLLLDVPKPTGNLEAPRDLQPSNGVRRNRRGEIIM
jgi:hypothetical protein